MMISVVIPMFNEERHIARTLESIRCAAVQAALAHEVLVVDNGSTDSGPDIARGKGARVLEGAGMNIGGLRNRGARAAQGQWLAFVDADMEMPANWLTLWSAIHTQNRADMLALACVAPGQAPWFARAWQRRTLGSGRAQQRDWLPSANLCLRREWFERVSGFDESLSTGEDKDFGLRMHAAGARLLLLPEPAALHWGFEASWAEWGRKELWRQSSHLQLLGERPGWRQLRFPALSVATLLLTLVALLAGLYGAPGVLSLALGVGLLVAFGQACRQSWRQRAPLLTMQLTALHWLRLHLTAVSLIGSVFHLSSRRPARG